LVKMQDWKCKTVGILETEKLGREFLGKGKLGDMAKMRTGGTKFFERKYFVGVKFNRN